MNAGEIKANSKTNGEITGANEANLSATPHANLSAKNPRTNLNPSAQNPNLGANSNANLNEANLDATPHANLNPSAPSPNAGANLNTPNLGAKNPRASQRELEGNINFSQLEKSDFTPNSTQENKIVGDGFVAKDGDLNFTDRVRFELGEYLKNNLNLNDNPLNVSLNYLFNHHREMFDSRRDVLNSVKELLDSIPEVIKKREDGSYYLAKSITHTPTNRSSKMIDMTIGPQLNENYINHLNRGKYNKNMREAMDISDGKDAPLLTHQSELTGALSDNHSGLYSRSSPIDGEILPQNADNFAQNLSQSADNLPNANLSASNLSGELPNANAHFHNPRAEFSANNAYENFSNPNNPHAFMSGDDNPRFMPYSPSQNPRANARELEERTGFFNQNGKHLGAKEVALMNGSVDFTHLKKSDFAPNSSEDLAHLNELKKEFGIYDSAQEVGLFGKSDLNDMSKDTLFAKDNLIARSLNKTRIFGENSRIFKTANKFDDWISDIYQGEDNIMRYVAFASHYNYTNEIRQQKWKIWTNIGPNFMKSYRKLYKSSNKKYFLSTVPL